MAETCLAQTLYGMCGPAFFIIVDIMVHVQICLCAAIETKNMNWNKAYLELAVAIVVHF